MLTMRPSRWSLHDRQHGLDRGEEPENLVAQLLFEDRERRAFDRAADVGAGVIHQDVDAAKRFVRLGDERIDRGFVGHIGWNAEHAIAGAGEFVHGVIEPFRVAGADRDRASFR